MTAEPGFRLELRGRLVLVVGASGAGKDSLIRYARERLGDSARFVFPRRVVTRPGSEAEDNIEVDEERFAKLVAESAFATEWQAHGLHYGIPAAIDAELAAGRSVVCNVSRQVVQGLRLRYPDVLVVEITAPAHLLAARIAARGRTADGKTLDRLARSAHLAAERPDLVISNDGELERAGREFVTALLEGGAECRSSASLMNC